MILNIDTNAAYLVLPKSHSRISAHFYFSDHPPTNDTPWPKLSSHILTICQTPKHVVASEVEAETGGMFLNVKSMVPIRSTLIVMYRPQPDNGNPHNSRRKNGVDIRTLFHESEKRSKSWDMRYCWI